MIENIGEFIRRCETATNDEIYEMFEFEASGQVIIDVLSFADPSSPEPFRSAMYNLGFTDY